MARVVHPLAAMSRRDPAEAVSRPAGSRSPCAAEPPLRYALFGGRIGLPTRRQHLRAAPAAALWLAAYPVLGRLVARVGGPTSTSRLQRRWARGLARHLRLRLELSGLEQITPGRTYLVAPLHEGFADVLALLHLPLRMRFVVRDEIFGWPILGPYLRATEQIEVRPERGAASYRRTVRQARTIAAGGESIVIFPQGTILGIESEFRPGVFALARAIGASILPVAITGSHRVWEHPYSPRLRYGQRVSLRVLEPLTLGPRDDPYAVCAETQRKLKAVALSGAMAPPRRFVPARDGYWDGYAYEIDPAFPELATEIAGHRAGRRATAGPPSGAL